MTEAPKKTPKKKATKKPLEKIDINGRVLDVKGEGIAEVLVELLERGLRTYTDAEGNYSLTEVSPGHDTLRLLATGFAEQRQPLELTEKLKNYDITLEST